MLCDESDAIMCKYNLLGVSSFYSSNARCANSWDNNTAFLEEVFDTYRVTQSNIHSSILTVCMNISSEQEISAI